MPIPISSTPVAAIPPSGPKAPPVMNPGPVARTEISRPEWEDLSTAIPNKLPNIQFHPACHADAPHSPPSAKAQTAAMIPKRKRFSHPIAWDHSVRAP